MDSNQRKLSLADLQSAPFSHSGIYPITNPLIAGAEVSAVTHVLTSENIAKMRKKFGQPGNES
ncbi:MAG: hypothetical protein RLZZ282_1793 [Verrucomicrobiota bacterium]